MLKKVRKWANISKKQNSYEERTNVQASSFDIVKTQYSTENGSDIQVFDDIPNTEDIDTCKNEVIVTRSDRLNSIEVVSKSSNESLNDGELEARPSLSFEEQETLDFLNSVCDDAMDGDDVSHCPSNHDVIDDASEANKLHKDINDDVNKKDNVDYSTILSHSSLSSSSSQVDNWSLEHRQHNSSGRLKMMTSSAIYLPETPSLSNSQDDEDDSDGELRIDDDFHPESPDLPPPDYPDEEEDAQNNKDEINIEEENNFNQDDGYHSSKKGDLSNIDTNTDTEKSQDTPLPASSEENTAPGISHTTATAVTMTRGTSFNCPQGRSKLSVKIQPEENNTKTESDQNLSIEPSQKLKSDTSPSLSSNIDINTKNNKIKDKSKNNGGLVTAFSQRNDDNNNFISQNQPQKGPIMTSFKSAQDNDLLLISKEKPVNNLVKKFETMATS